MGRMAEGRLKKRGERMTTKSKKPRVCPRCGSGNVIPIVYGYPSPELEKQSQRGKVMLGGCCVGDDNTQWYCKECENRWRKERTKN
jgi:hypothetical protein